jgi:hypothetical protein
MRQSLSNTFCNGNDSTSNCTLARATAENTEQYDPFLASIPKATLHYSKEMHGTDRLWLLCFWTGVLLGLLLLVYFSWIAARVLKANVTIQTTGISLWRVIRRKGVSVLNRSSSYSNRFF